MTDKILLSKAVNAAKKKIKLNSDKQINKNLSYFCEDFAEAYRVGVEETQQEILNRIRSIKP